LVHRLANFPLAPGALAGTEVIARSALADSTEPQLLPTAQTVHWTQETALLLAVLHTLHIQAFADAATVSSLGLTAASLAAPIRPIVLDRTLAFTDRSCSYCCYCVSAKTIHAEHTLSLRQFDYKSAF
jgi:hypothetical protein